MTHKIIPGHQFGFRNSHATIEQVNRVTTGIKNAFEKRSYCSAIFLDIAQAFDKVWHEGLLFKLKNILHDQHFHLLESYIKNRHFQVKINEVVTSLFGIGAGVPQGSVLGPIPYLLYTADLPTMQDIVIALFADDTAALSTHIDPAIASKNLQQYLNKLQHWYNKWRIISNESKSIHVTFTLCKLTCPPVYLNDKQLPQRNSVKYLGMHLDRRLTYQEHIWTKRNILGLKLRKMYWLIGRNSALSLENKILIYKCILKPVWTYGIELWGTASKSNVDILERYQSKVLRQIVDAPWFVPNEIIRKDLNINSVKEEIKIHIERYNSRLEQHPNNLAIQLIHQNSRPSRLKRFSFLL